MTELLGRDEFVEIFIDVPLEEGIRRDPKGLYAKSFGGQDEEFYRIGGAEFARHSRAEREACQAATRIVKRFLNTRPERSE